MKALTIQQPYATLLLQKDKKYETRSWTTKYRGPVAIHAAKAWNSDIFQYLLSPLATIDCLERLGITPTVIEEEMPKGAIIGTAELVNIWKICRRPDPEVNGKWQIFAKSMTEDIEAPDYGKEIIPTEQEKALGHWNYYSQPMYAWEFQNIKALAEPIPAKGKQGLWNWDGEIK